MRRAELGRFLRARRETLQPEDVGLPRVGRRRVGGLRRHEVADLAAVSVTWYTWLEQGREIRTTRQVIESISRALHLDDEAARYIRRLAGLHIDNFAMSDGRADPILMTLLDDALPNPAYLVTPAGDLLAWNAGYRALFGDPASLPRKHRNALWMMLTDEGTRQWMVDWEAESRYSLARFHTEFSKYPGDPRLEELTKELAEVSELFRDEWQLQHVRSFTSHVQSINHPVVGTIHAQLVQLRSLDQPSTLIVVHRATDDDSLDRLRQLVQSDPPSALTLLNAAEAAVDLP